MGCRILEDKENGAVFYCSTTGWAFGPVMDDEEEAEEFMNWLHGDPRSYTEKDLLNAYAKFRTEQEAQNSV